MIDTQAQRIVDHMLLKDAYSRWLGIDVLAITPGACRLKMMVREEMLNGFEIAHGGIVYAFADSALAFTSNSHGFQAYSVETSISHVERISRKDELYAEAIELKKTRKMGWYKVVISNEKGEEVSFFKGTVYFTPKTWKV
jgi:acyl-CoA thioesterase